MLILCPNCATSYNVEPGTLGANGRSVRCASCHSVWFAAPPDAPLPRAASRVAEAIAEAEAALDIAPEDTLPERPQEVSAESSELETGDLDLAERQSAEDATADASPGDMPDREPEAVTDAPPLVPHDLDGDTPPALPDEPPSDIESFAARRARRPLKRSRKLPVAGLPAAILVLLAVNTILLGWRGEVVRLMPQTASLYAAIGLPVNLRGLVFSGVKTTLDAHDGVQVLAVEGTIDAVSNRAVEVPRLRFAVRDGNGHEIYAWTALATRNVLAPGETLPFRSRLASPPAEARDIVVRFFNRRDLLAGMQ